MLINDKWGITPIFNKKKHALEFKKEKWNSEDLKVIKGVLYD